MAVIQAFKLLRMLPIALKFPQQIQWHLDNQKLLEILHKKAKVRKDNVMLKNLIEQIELDPYLERINFTFIPGAQNLADRLSRAPPEDQVPLQDPPVPSSTTLPSLSLSHDAPLPALSAPLIPSAPSPLPPDIPGSGTPRSCTSSVISHRQRLPPDRPTST